VPQDNVHDLATLLLSDSGSVEAALDVSALGDTQAYGDLVLLWQELLACVNAGAAPLPRCASASELVLSELALCPGAKSTAAVMSLLCDPGMDKLHPGRARELVVRWTASRLAYAQPRDVLLSLLAEPMADPLRTEILACWLHELILRGDTLPEAEARGFQQRLSEKGHALASMPLALTAEEREANTYLPMYGTEAIEAAVKALDHGPQSLHSLPPPDGANLPVTTDVVDVDLSLRMREAVSPWTVDSDGRVEAKVFTLEPALDAGLSRSLLRSLPLESTQGDGLVLTAVTADVVWGALFAAGANGGANTQGLGGAYGRRAAWASLGALLGMPAKSTIADVSAAARGATFAMFGGTKFFADVAWDIGVVALREGKKTIAVLAATDNDAG
jgi:hypothetical protein